MIAGGGGFNIYNNDKNLYWAFEGQRTYTASKYYQKYFVHKNKHAGVKKTLTSLITAETSMEENADGC